MPVKIDNLANEITKALKEYTDEVTEGLEEVKAEVAKEGVKMLKATSPRGKRKRYYKGWRVKRIGTAQVIHNATDYQLTHLLEKGHAKRGGGRVPPKVHIAPVEEKVIEEFEKRVEKVIRG